MSRTPSPRETDLEPDSTPTPPPVAVALERPPVAAARSGRSWVEAAFVGAAFALPIVGWIAANHLPPVAHAEEVAPNAAAVVADARSVAALPAALPEPVQVADAPVMPRADEHLNRDGRHYPIHGGVLFTPTTFASADGAYDLYLHFHGNTGVVLESAEHAGVNALVAVVNLGVGSAPYEDAYNQPGSYAAILADVQRGATERGLVGAHVRRIALGSWSAGYGAIGGILRQPKNRERFDAILVLDGIHVGWIQDDPKNPLNVRNLAPFLEAARDAARGDFFFSITHSEVLPEDYASSSVTADLLLEAAGGSRHAADPTSAPDHVALAAAKNAVSKRLEKHMEPLTEATVGSLHVRGYRGNTPEHHMAHLLQMGATVMPELAARWEHAPASP